MLQLCTTSDSEMYAVAKQNENTKKFRQNFCRLEELRFLSCNCTFKRRIWQLVKKKYIQKDPDREGKRGQCSGPQAQNGEAGFSSEQSEILQRSVKKSECFERKMQRSKGKWRN